MLNNFKSRFTWSMETDQRSNDRKAETELADKFPYGRPSFLQLLTPDELRASANHGVRPIIVPRDISLLPWGTGYAECINSGKSRWNEDQASFRRNVLVDMDMEHPDLPYMYFGIFDGHAGYGASLAASQQFHDILHSALLDCINHLLPRDEEGGDTRERVRNPPYSNPKDVIQRRVSKDELIIGALEGAFLHMDSLMEQDKNYYKDAGGCTACVALFIDGKMYVANAGDSRAVLCQRRLGSTPAATATATAATTETPEGTTTTTGSTETNKVESDGLDIGFVYSTPFSYDHTPESERERLMHLAILKPNLIGHEYVASEYAIKPRYKDLGRRILCRDGNMKGWAYRTITRNDVLMPVVNGEGKRSRLLGTLGVTRGFGDHDLRAINTNIKIKPFLTPQPDVIQRDLSQVVSIPDEHNEDGDYGVLVMGTDGLWDVSENDAVARTVFEMLSRYPKEKHRYTMAAQELVARARGKINESGHWRLADSKAPATVDDISVIVIPVYQYYKEHVEWKQKGPIELKMRKRMAKSKINHWHIQRAMWSGKETQSESRQNWFRIVQEPVEGEDEPRLAEEQRTQLEPEETLVVELSDATAMQARLEKVNATLQNLQLDTSAEIAAEQTPATATEELDAEAVQTADTTEDTTTTSNEQSDNCTEKASEQ